MGAVLLEPPEQHWVCPNCTQTDRTRGKPNRFHRCRGLAGLLAPMVPDGADCAVEAVERQDYVGRELVTYDGEGRPVMAVVTRRADGSNDVMVNAPAARVEAL
jgi:hypothetical protein